ncbi:hypothetical protein D3C73_1020760 [compost metagenome]
MYMVTSGLPFWSKSARESLIASPPKSGLPSALTTLMAYSSKTLEPSLGLTLHINFIVDGIAAATSGIFKYALTFAVSFCSDIPTTAPGINCCCPFCPW